MLKHRWTDRVCCIVLAVMLLATGALMGAQSAGLIAEDRAMGYETRLFDQSRVHTIELIMDDWEGFLETCTNEEYTPCTVIIDGEAYANVGLRAKGNTSLSSVRQYGNNRYSFKIEFDQYASGGSYYGLDKLSLNNIIQDYTYLKDYMTYTMMNKLGAAAPLCSFAQISVNGEEWGLYLAAEAVEDGFLRRNYGADAGELYKPDSMSFGGGRGNGRDFDMDAFAETFAEAVESGEIELPEGVDAEDLQNFDPSKMGGFDPAQMGGMAMPEGFDPSRMGGFNPMEMPQASESDDSQSGQPTPPESFDPSQMDGMTPPEGFDPSDMDFSNMTPPGDFGGGRGGMGSSDVRLQYTDDDPASYSNIFSSAKTDVSEADQTRLIAALKAMNEGDTSAVDTDAVMRYLTVHDFVCNGDSYTGAMVHNYYLYEKDGVLSMLPWDYNLAMGAFNMGGMGGSGATSTVNSPIDTPVSDGDMSSRPMVAWIFNSEETIAQYHEIYDEFIETVFESGWFEETVTTVSEMIAPYVESDPTKFCTYEQFTTGVEALKQFGALRAESVRGQLDGTIPSTREGQNADSSALVDGSGLSLNDMGEFGMGGGMGGKGGFSRGDRSQRPDAMSGATENPESGQTEAPQSPDQPENGSAAQNPDQPENDSAQQNAVPPTDGKTAQSPDQPTGEEAVQPEVTAQPEATAVPEPTASPEVQQPNPAEGAPAMGEMPGGMTPPNMGEMPEGMTPPDMGQMPEGMTPPNMGQMPEGMTPPNMGELPEGMAFPGMGQNGTPPQMPGN